MQLLLINFCVDLYCISKYIIYSHVISVCASININIFYENNGKHPLGGRRLLLMKYKCLFVPKLFFSQKNNNNITKLFMSKL